MKEVKVVVRGNNLRRETHQSQERVKKWGSFWEAGESMRREMDKFKGTRRLRDQRREDY